MSRQERYNRHNGFHAAESESDLFPATPVMPYGVLGMDPPGTVEQSGVLMRESWGSYYLNPPAGQYAVGASLFQLGNQGGVFVNAGAAPAISPAFVFAPGHYRFNGNHSFAAITTGGKYVEWQLFPVRGGAFAALNQFIGRGAKAALSFVAVGQLAIRRWEVEFFAPETFAVLLVNGATALVTGDVLAGDVALHCLDQLDQTRADLQPTEAR